jgi:hypothetical protein
MENSSTRTFFLSIDYIDFIVYACTVESIVFLLIETLP